MKRLTLSFLVLTIMLMAIGSVSASHTADVSITTNTWLKTNTATDFNIKIINEEGASIKEVLIDIPGGYSSLSCGVAPTDWSIGTLTDSDTCHYKTTTDLISSGSSKEFNLTVTTSTNIEDTWFVATKDSFDIGENSVAPQGLTISEAIELAESEDTIIVPAGTYNENVVIENKENIIIDGSAGAIIEPTSGIGFAIKNSDDITITGFTINTIGEDAHGVWVAGESIGDSDNLVIENNIINIGGKSSGIYSHQVSPSHGGWIITGNTISAPNQGVNIELYDVNDVTISGNTLEISGSESLVYSSENSNVGTAVISGNTFNGNGDPFEGGELEGIIPLIWIESDFINWDGDSSVNEVTITGNTINDWTNAAVMIGEDVELGLCGTNCNDVSGVTINENKFLKETLTTILKSYLAETVDATNNWWGSETPDFDTLVSGNVDYVPYCFDKGCSADEVGPIITFENTPYNNELEATTTIAVKISDSSGISSYEINWKDGSLSEEGDGEEETLVELTGENSPTHIYAGVGEYEVEVTATDIYNNVNVETVKVAIYEEPDWIVELQEGWNLISIPLMAENSSIDVVFAEIIDDIVYDGTTYTIFQYDATNGGSWSKARVLSDRSGFYGSLDYLVPGHAYWVKMENPATLYGYEKEFAPGELPVPSVDLATGMWNLVGSYSVLDDIAFGTAFELLDDNYFDSNILEFDNSGQTWTAAENIDTGKGYWLRTKVPASGASTIAYEPGSYYFDRS